MSQPAAHSMPAATLDDDDRILVPASALNRLAFDNRFTRSLPADPIDDARTRTVTGAAYSRVRPVAVPQPRIVAWSQEVSELLGLDDEVWSHDEAAEVFSGNKILAGSDPHAAAYGGHQFGNWAGQLGDGRAIALGEVVDRQGRHQTLQLKGAGPTPYSRRADGLAVLRSSIREFLCSEAMHHLGVPTTRALSLALTGNQVLRDMFYDGHPRDEQGAVVCRVAPSFIRFGNFQLFAARGELDHLRALADFTVRHHFAHLVPPSDRVGDVEAAATALSPEVYAAFFDEVCRLSCEMVVAWMRVGFVHGVMNTDNMSIHGLTIDYGPYGWLDDYDPTWTPNTTDAADRRYRFGQQPQIVQWNLLQLANALFPLVGEAEPLEASLNAYVPAYQEGYRRMMLDKLGLVAGRPVVGDPAPGPRVGDDGSGDDALVADLVGLLTAVETDMTIFFQRLADLPDDPATPVAHSLGPDGLGDAFYRPEQIGAEVEERYQRWLDRYRRRLAAEGRPSPERKSAMARVNPRYVLRNYLAQEAIDAAEAGDYALIEQLAAVLRHPYDEQPDGARLAVKRPDWARSRPGCSMLSCSS